MTATATAEWHEWAADLSRGDLRVRAGFRSSSLTGLAGGPLEIQFFVEASAVITVAVGANRLIQRPDFFRFAAELDGRPIDDPFAGSTDLGGPATTVSVGPASPFTQWLIVNQFLRLEQARERVAPGEVGRLHLRGGRPLPLAKTPAEAFDRSGASEFDVSQDLELRRDDAQLVSLIDQLVDEVRAGRERREHALALLLTLRAPPAVRRWRTLQAHPDAVVAERVRHALSVADRINAQPLRG
jgi:hypothetical protein